MTISHREMVKGIMPKTNRKSRRKSLALARSQNAAASYARYSTSLQNDSSNEDQHRTNTTAAKKNEHTIAREHYYSDSEVSGTCPDREGLNRLVEDAEAGEFSTIYFFSLSRLARESLIGKSIIKKLVSLHGIRIISVSEGIDTAQTGWEMGAELLLMFHEKFLQQLAADVLRGQEGAVVNGRSVGDHRYGYQSVVDEDAPPPARGKKPAKKYVINEEEAEWVKQIFSWFVHHRYSITRIVKELNIAKVPKGHRGQREHWSHTNVKSILECPKYVGVWSWGLLKNHRNPETGKTWQEPREQGEILNEWTRIRADLQIVEIEVFKLAQERLQKNEELYAKHRTPGGQFNSHKGSTGNPPRKLLSGLLVCSECGHKFYYGGTHGKYLFCPGYNRGKCGCKTRVPKDVATELILKLVVSTVLGDSKWLGKTFDATVETWERIIASIPGQIAATERQIEKIEGKIARLLDKVEDGVDDLDIRSRLENRRKERAKLHSDLAKLQRKTIEKKEAPTFDWVKTQLQAIGNSLQDEDPTTIDALHQLVGGQIFVTEIRPEKGRRFLRADMRLKARNTCKLLLGLADAPGGADDSDNEIQIEIDLKRPPALLEPSERAKKLYDEGKMNAEIAQIMGISKSMVTKLLRYWFESRDQEMPDGRSRRSTLDRKHLEPPYYQVIADEVQQLLDSGLLIKEVSQSIGCDINTVRKASEYWHESRGLEYQDGRNRRKTLDHRVCKTD